jgi:hypothetical protein
MRTWLLLALLGCTGDVEAPALPSADPPTWSDDVDSDGDGLSDAEEIALGTDPLSVDADADGVPDGTEVAWGTSSWSADTDGDGLRDGQEALYGTSPILWDSDGDGLDDGEELRMGTSPAHTDTDGDGLDDGDEVSLGLDPASTDSDRDGLDDGDEFARGTDPSRADTDGDGLGDGVEVTVGADPLAVDSDGDGLGDGVEATLGSDRVVVDSDGDGLPDGLEHDTYGTDPVSPDTDGDGLTDADELASGTSPVRADTDRDGVADGDELAGGADPLDAFDRSPPCPVGDALDCLGRCVAAVPDGFCTPSFDCVETDFEQGECGATTRYVPGDLVIASSTAYRAAAGVRRVGGTLRIQPGAPPDLVLPRLEEVGGVSVTGPLGPLHTLALPRLHTVEDDLVVRDHPALSTVYLPALGSVGGRLVVDTPAEILVLGALDEAGTVRVAGVGDAVVLGVTTAAEVEVLDARFVGFPSLVQGDTVEIAGVHHLSAPGLSEVETLSVVGPTTVSLPALEVAGHAVFDVGSLPAVALPALSTVDVLQVQGQTLLFAPELAAAGELDLRGDPVDADLSGLRTADRLVFVGARSVPLPVLERVDALQMQDMAATSIDLPALSEPVSELRLVDLWNLAGALGVVLADGASVHLERVPMTAQLDLGAPQEVFVGETAVQTLTLADDHLETLVLDVNPELTTVVLPAAWPVRRYVTLHGNAQLTSVPLPTATPSTSFVHVLDNPRFQPCGWELLAADRTPVIAGNAACP